jgi:hypothetical protein
MEAFSKPREGKSKPMEGKSKEAGRKIQIFSFRISIVFNRLG